MKYFISLKRLKLVLFSHTVLSGFVWIPKWKLINHSWTVIDSLVTRFGLKMMESTNSLKMACWCWWRWGLGGRGGDGSDSSHKKGEKGGCFKKMITPSLIFVLTNPFQLYVSLVVVDLVNRYPTSASQYFLKRKDIVEHCKVDFLYQWRILSV